MKVSWTPPKHPAWDVKPSDLRRSMPSESTHASRNCERDDYLAHNQERRSSFETQQHYGSFAAKRHPRVPLPTQNQQSRLHNRVSVFEGVTQPYIPGLSSNNHADAASWRGKEANGTPSNTLSLYEGSKHKVEESEASSQHGINNTCKKGTMFLSKLEEVCSNLKKKDEFTRQNFSMNKEPLREEEALRDDNASTQVGQGFQNATGQGRSAHGNGVSISLKRKDVQSARYTDSDDENFVENSNRTNTGDYMLKKTATGDDVGITSFNLFSSAPSVPWDADRRYSTTFKPCIPIRRGYGSRRLSTSVGSRSIPSQLSVKSQNFLKHPSHAATGVMGLLKSGERGEQMKPWLEDKDGIKTQDALEFKDIKFTASQKRVPQFINQVESLDFDWSDSDSEEKEDNMFMHSGAEEKADNVVTIPLAAEEVTPIESSSSARSPHINLICRDSDSKVDGDNVLPDLLNAKYDASPLGNQVDGDNLLPDLSNAIYDASPLGKPNCSDAVSKIDGDNAEDATPTQSNSIERSLSNKKDIFSSALLTCTQDTTSATPPVAVSSGAPDTCNDSNSSNSASWQKHNLPNLPFEFQYSYSEMPKAPVLGYREAPFSPFGPRTMGRPWTGRPPLNPSKKKVREFDSFNPPPRDKKGIKFVQDPGPYPEGQSPKPAKSREEVMGEPLTKEEIVYLVEKCQRESRQLNLGRDGLTHNMLDMIHSHWKRRRVCRIKCKGVPTVDMENVMFHIEDKTGGKIIYHTGGVLYLFRGRNYNYKDRPQIPLMLWKPAAPVYPKLIQPDPGGLTIKEAQKLCRLGRKTEPICRLGKNGVYLTLVEDVRTAFKVDDLVRIDCQGLNPSDYKKIGAKLRDLVPCVLLSFDKEQILMWRGKKEPSVEGTNLSETPNREAAPTSVCSDVVECSDPIITQNGTEVSVDASADVPSLADEEVMKQFPMADDKNANKKNSEKEGTVSTHELVPSKLSDYATAGTELETNAGSCAGGDSAPEEVSKSMDSKLIKTSYEELVPVATVSLKFSEHEVEGNREAFDGLTSTMVQACEHLDNQSDLVVRVDALWDHAFQSGMAIELTEADTDSDLIVRKAAQLAQSAPLGPKYTLNLIHKLQLKTEEDRPDDVLRIQFGRGKPPKRQQKVVKQQFQLPTVDVPRMGGLPVDNLAMLLAPK